MGLVTPEIGLLFWTLLAFLITWGLLGKFAWKPIAKAIREREDNISESLKAAEQAKLKMAELEAKNEDLLKEARETKNQIISEAKNAAKEEGEKILAAAREAIDNEKMAALTELKNQVAGLSIDIAEKILRNELDKEDKQKKLIDNLLDDLNPN